MNQQQDSQDKKYQENETQQQDSQDNITRPPVDKITVDELASALFAAFPREDAEDWDMPGLCVGNKAMLISGIAVALDMSAAAVIAAHAAGCNVLLTHHPAYIAPAPSEFVPATTPELSGAGRAIFEAARLGVACIAMHTNLDRSVDLRKLVAAALCGECGGNVEHLFNEKRSSQGSGYGALMEFTTIDVPTLRGIAHICADACKTVPRVWGKADERCRRYAFLNGSWSEMNVFSSLLKAGINCVVVGETKYHLSANIQPFMNIIELGHDRSELFCVDLLYNTMQPLAESGIKLVKLDSSLQSWWSL